MGVAEVGGAGVEVGGEAVGAVGVVGVGGAGDEVGELEGAWPPTPATTMQIKPTKKRDWRSIIMFCLSILRTLSGYGRRRRE